MTNAMDVSRSHLVLIPSYNTGPKLIETVRAALKNWQPVWVIIDGSNDGSDEELVKAGFPQASFRILQLPKNSGKGAAVVAGMEAAASKGFTGALVLDADGQHPANQIPVFMKVAAENPDAMVLGVPQFGPDAPASRRHGRKVGNWWAGLETLWGGLRDSLFGFRVYPVPETLKIVRRIKSGRGYDFDTVLAVRLVWAGVRPINISVPVRYFDASEGGISHFRYWRDNLLLILRHTCLVLEMPLHYPAMSRHRHKHRQSQVRRVPTKELPQ